ncbi:T9SS type A sorting domain-containing protein [Flavivirga aquimarina]|uniref:T9SS type A sorting domain-containing protein n=1 Tax=Flavivirga aquimarina TaxID=2027862 RepID=A0ABT8WFB0_9FLAO|nr:T9SS type A sorting domain-containing protein [Flavivirga aquimarina]MDO5971709.1 T9SS type A sorting domain-containing protein [Flavivirga aquimarina]
MKQKTFFRVLYFLMLVQVCITAEAQNGDDPVNIPDVNFKNALLNYSTTIDTNDDDEISYAEAEAFTGTINVNNKAIADLTGIEAFVNITTLYCYDNALTSLDVSNNTALTYLSCRSNALTSLDVSNNTALTSLHCYSNALTSLDVSNNTALTNLRCYSNALTSLDVSNNTALTSLYCYSNDLTSLDVSNNTALTYLRCGLNALPSLDVSNNTALTFLNCYSNNLTSLDVSNNTALTNLHCQSNALPSLDVSNNMALTDLHCYSNNLISLDISNNTGLEFLNCSFNALTSLDVSNNTALTFLNCSSNDLTHLNVANGNNTDIDTDITGFRASDNPNLTCIQVDDVAYSTTNWADIDSTASFSEVPCPVYISDVNFKDALLENTAINTDSDTDEISYAEAEAFTGTIDINNKDIEDLTGIEAFVNLSGLDCSYNTLNSLDVSNNTALTTLDCSNNNLIHLNMANGNNTAITSFIATNNPNLTCIQVDDVAHSTANWTDDIDNTASFSEESCLVNIPDTYFKDALLEDTAINTNIDTEISYAEALAFTGTMNVSDKGIADLTGIEAFVNITSLRCSSNNLTNLDVSDNMVLESLYCDDNALTSLDVSNNTALESLGCYSNELTSLDVSNNTVLRILYCDTNALTSLDVSNNTDLANLRCNSNALTSLDVSNNTALTYLDCRSNALTSLDVSNNTDLESLYCYANALTNLDVSNNMALTYLSCYANALTSLDVSNNMALTYLYCHSNALTLLNVANGNNTNIANTHFRADDNPYLTCIQVDDAAYSTTNWINMDNTASFNTNCSTLSINDEVFSNSISVNNPVTSVLTINSPAGFEIKEATLYTILGKQVLSTTNTTVNTSTLPSGLYLLKIENTQGLTATKKIVKQ